MAAVLLAAYVVKSLPLATLRWGVVAVVLYAAALLLHSACARPRSCDRRSTDFRHVRTRS